MDTRVPTVWLHIAVGGAVTTVSALLFFVAALATKSSFVDAFAFSAALGCCVALLLVMGLRAWFWTFAVFLGFGFFYAGYMVFWRDIADKFQVGFLTVVVFSFLGMFVGLVAESITLLHGWLHAEFRRMMGSDFKI